MPIAQLGQILYSWSSSCIVNLQVAWTGRWMGRAPISRYHTSYEFRIVEDLKAESSSNCNSSCPEPPAASHKTGLSLAVLFLNPFLAGAVTEAPPNQPLYVKCLSLTLQACARMKRGPECRLGGAICSLQSEC